MITRRCLLFEPLDALRRGGMACWNAEGGGVPGDEAWEELEEAGHRRRILRQRRDRDEGDEDVVARSRRRQERDRRLRRRDKANRTDEPPPGAWS
jgi:hypothetical protein